MGIYAERLTKLWQTYDKTKAIDEIERLGFIICGTGKYQPKIRFLRRLRQNTIKFLNWLNLRVLGSFRYETDGGHTFGTMILADLINRFFPEHLPDQVHALVLQCLIYHEADELLYGDQLDDGTQNITHKTSEAVESLNQLLSDTPRIDHIVAIICRAEELKGVPYDAIDNTNIAESAAWWLKAIDKTEAILQNGRYRKARIVGHLSQRDNPSERDLASIDKIGTDDITFVWADVAQLHLRDSLLWDIIIAMMHDVYKEAPHEIPLQFQNPPI